jgi:D-glycero-D-manno-heptose 1,7-bisphosphate phosphatase
MLLLDRDGVVIPDPGYPYKLGDMQVDKDVSRLLADARKAGWIFGFVSNQGGVGLGKFTWDQYSRGEQELERQLNDFGAKPHFWLACGMHPDAELAEYKVPDHPWRKPNAGMIVAAMQHYGIDAGRCFMVGDRLTDMQAAQLAGVQSILFSCEGKEFPPSDFASAKTASDLRAVLDAFGNCQKDSC